MALDLTALENAVAKVETVKESVIAFANGIKAKLDQAIADLAAAGNTPAELQKLNDLSAAIGEDADAMAAAVVANTPSSGE